MVACKRRPRRIDSTCEKSPWSHAGQNEQPIRNSSSGRPERAREHHGENRHGKQGLQDGPEYAQQGLTVTQHDVTPGQKEEECLVPAILRDLPEERGAGLIDYGQQLPGILWHAARCETGGHEGTTLSRIRFPS